MSDEQSIESADVQRPIVVKRQRLIRHVVTYTEYRPPSLFRWLFGDWLGL